MCFKIGNRTSIARVFEVVASVILSVDNGILRMSGISILGGKHLILSYGSNSSSFLFTTVFVEFLSDDFLFCFPTLIWISYFVEDTLQKTDDVLTNGDIKS